MKIVCTFRSVLDSTECTMNAVKSVATVINCMCLCYVLGEQVLVDVCKCVGVFVRQCVQLNKKFNHK